MKANDRRALRRLAPFVLAEWRRLILALVFMVVGIMLQLPLPLVTRYIIDSVLPGRDVTLLNWVIAGLFGFMILKSLADLAHGYFLAVLRERVLMTVQIALFEHVESQSLSFFQNTKSGYLASKLNNDVSNLGGLVGGAFLNLLRDVTMLVVGAAVIFAFHWRLALASVFVLPFFIASVQVFAERVRSRSAEFQERFAAVWDAFQEVLTGIFVVKSCQLERFEAEKMENAIGERRKAAIRLSLASSWSNLVTAFVGGLGPLVILWYGGREVIAGHLSLGTLMAYNLFLAYLYGPAQRLMTLNSEVHASLASLERVLELFDTAPAVKDPAEPVTLATVRGGVAFEDVSFSYDTANFVLRDVNLSARSGETVALVGRSGAGKSTLVALIARLFDPTNGVVRLDGVNVKDLRQRDLRRVIGIVPQDVFLFSGTIRENIRIGRLGAGDREVEEATVLANADGFVRRLPRAFETEVGERGVKLSGGERQRIAIARAILRDPRVLILDEATSDLDSESERLIQEALARLCGSRTTFVVAHRFATVLVADKIVVLDGGRIVAEGSHEELYGRVPLYRELCLNQFITSESRTIERDSRLAWNQPRGTAEIAARAESHQRASREGRKDGR